MSDTSSPQPKQPHSVDDAFAAASRERCAPVKCNHGVVCWVRDGGKALRGSSNITPRCAGCNDRVNFWAWQPPSITRIDVGPDL